MGGKKKRGERKERQSEKTKGKGNAQSGKKKESGKEERCRSTVTMRYKRNARHTRGGGKKGKLKGRMS